MGKSERAIELKRITGDGTDVRNVILKTLAIAGEHLPAVEESE